MEGLSLREDPNLFIALLKQRLSAETFHKFQDVVVKYVAESETVDRTMLFSEVNALFGTEHHDLIENFRYFLDNLDQNRASSVESNELNGEEEEDIPLIHEKEPIAIVVKKKSSVDFINRVQRVLKDDDKFMSFITTVAKFERHRDVERVEREAGFFLKEHPELKIQFSEFLAEANAGRKDQDIVVSEGRKRNAAETDGHRKWSDYEIRMFVYEDGLHKKDLGYNTLLRAKEAAERLIANNLGNENRRETIRIAGYFRGQNLKFMKELKIRNELLSKKSMERGKAISKSEDFVQFIEEGIEKLTKGWSEEKKRLAKKRRRAELKNPVFDWRAARRDVNESNHSELCEVRLCLFTASPIHRPLDLHSDSSSTTDCDCDDDNIRAFSTFIVKL